MKNWQKFSVLHLAMGTFVALLSIAATHNSAWPAFIDPTKHLSFVVAELYVMLAIPMCFLGQLNALAPAIFRLKGDGPLMVHVIATQCVAIAVVAASMAASLEK